jgi:hypothetical protein
MIMSRPDLLLLCLFVETSNRLRRRRPQGDRGDIPGWVMIAIMSAAVVVVLIPLVGPVIGKAFTNAVNSVSNTKSGP